jgi:glycerate 2-kinase
MGARRRAAALSGPAGGPPTDLSELGEAARQIAAAALAAADPARLVAAELARRGGPRFAGVLALGKAAAALARGAAPFLVDGPRLLIRPHSAPALGDPAWEELSGGHPLPDTASLAAGRRLADWLAALPPGGRLLALVSGGGSACLELPAASLTLADLAAVHRALLDGGVPIAAVNAVRAHLSRLKGGGALRLCPVPVLALVLSDVPGDDPAVVASGPFAADPSSYADALATLALAPMPRAVPAAVQSHLASGIAGQIIETVQPGDPAFARLTLVRIGGIGTAVEAAAACARRLGFAVATGELAGEAAAAGRELVGRGRRLPAGKRGAALVLGGETVVRLGPEPVAAGSGGRGGRSQELALAAAQALRSGGRDGTVEVVLALATDGEDGATGAAGAVVDGGSWAAMRDAGIDPERALAGHDSHSALAALPGALLTPGPTGTNVADLALYLADRSGGQSGEGDGVACGT